MLCPLRFGTNGVEMWVTEKQFGKANNGNRKTFHALTRTAVRRTTFALVLGCGVAAANGQAALIGGAPAAHMEQERQQMLAEQRQKKMIDDADRLVQMAQQLKESVDKSNKNTLSVDVIRKADRVEKLARQLKDNMRQ